MWKKFDQAPPICTTVIARNNKSYALLRVKGEYLEEIGSGKIWYYGHVPYEEWNEIPDTPERDEVLIEIISEFVKILERGDKEYSRIIYRAKSALLCRGRTI